MMNIKRLIKFMNHKKLAEIAFAISAKLIFDIMVATGKTMGYN